MPDLKPKREFFTKVKLARELLREKSEEILAEYMEIIRLAKENKDFDVAAKELRWLIEHMADEEGTRIVEQSVDKKQQPAEQTQKGPNIQIGIAVGGLGGKKELPKPIEVEILNDK